MQLTGLLLFVIAGIVTHFSQRTHKPAIGVALWILYVGSLVAGIALVTP